MLDRARLGKQRIECVQLLRAVRAARPALPDDFPADLRGAVGEVKRTGWVNHPAAVMWRGYASGLGLYATFVIREWVARGYKNNIPPPYTDAWEPNPAATDYAGPMDPLADVQLPPWLGDTVFHACHRSNLLRKDPQHYGQFGWREPPDLAYMWPAGLGFDGVD